MSTKERKGKGVLHDADVVCVFSYKTKHLEVRAMGGESLEVEGELRSLNFTFRKRGEDLFYSACRLCERY